MALPDRARHDVNLNDTLIAVSSGDGETPVSLWADPNTHALVTSGGGGGGGSYPSNVISTNNSSTATLTSGSVYTGVSDDVSAYADIRVTVFSDVASATNGASFQQSQDGTNWDQTDTYTIAAGVPKAFDFPVYAKYFRIVYTNGGTNQGAFRIQTVYHISRTKPSSQRPMDARPNDNDMEENLSYGMVYNVVADQWNRAKDTGVAGVQGVGVTDGANAANVVAGDTGFNGVVTAGAVKAIPFTTSTAGAQILLANTDIRGYAYAILNFTSVGTGLSLTPQWSPNTGGTYNGSNTWIRNDNLGPNSLNGLGTISTTVIYSTKVWGNFFQLSLSALTSGTVSGFITFYNAASPPQSLVVGSNSATGATVPANAFYMGMNNGAGQLNGLNALNVAADAVAGSGVLSVGGQYIYNGATYDRQRSATAAANTTGTGLLGVGNLIYDGTNYQLWPSRQGTSDALSSTITAAMVQNYPLLYNGNNFDRNRNNTTGAVIAAGATTAQTSTTQTTYNAAKLAIVINVSAFTSGTATFTVNGITSSGYTYPILASTALGATGVTVLRIFPGSTPSANAVANDLVPRSYNVVVSGTFVLTYGVDYILSV